MKLGISGHMFIWIFFYCFEMYYPPLNPWPQFFEHPVYVRRVVFFRHRLFHYLLCFVDLQVLFELEYFMCSPKQLRKKSLGKLSACIYATAIRLWMVTSLSYRRPCEMNFFHNGMSSIRIFRNHKSQSYEFRNFGWI